MVMNKKGYLRILEAIIAIIIVFTAVILVLPKTEKNTGKIPPDLELTANAILKEIQNNNEFRKCVLGGRVTYPDGSQEYVSGTQCIGNFIKYLRPSGSAWSFAMKICKADDPNNCNDYYSCYNSNPEDCQKITITTESAFIKNNLPTGKDIFTKSVIISVQDPTAQPIPPPPEQVLPTDENKILKLYFWVK